MASAEFPPSHIGGRRIYAERSKGSDPPLAEALLAVVTAVQTGLHTGPMMYAGDPPQPIAMTPEAVAEWLEDVQRARRAGTPALFTLAAEPSPTSTSTLTYEADPWAENAVEWVWYPVSAASLPPVDEVLDLVITIAQGFGAHRAVVEDDLLMMRYRGARAAERARSALPPDLRQYIPVPSLTAPIGGGLPELLVPQEFDRRRVPDAVWWINVWDGVQVATVGRRRILGASWVRVSELPDGGLALAATELPPDPRNPHDLTALASIAEVLDLRAVQNAHRLST